ncbi:MAG: MoaD/ThiS family protein [Anaerolineae bacterium]|nr:MoaD/ThiS family protein [Anaerolineae bacterium]
MEILIEFNGIPRILAGERQLQLQLEEGVTFREIIRLLGKRYPKMIGQVVHPDGETLYSSQMMNLNGEHMVQPEQMGDSPKHGDRIIMMSILAGG